MLDKTRSAVEKFRSFYKLDREGKLDKIWAVFLELLFSKIFEGFFLLAILAAFTSVILYNDLTFQ